MWKCFILYWVSLAVQHDVTLPVRSVYTGKRKITAFSFSQMFRDKIKFHNKHPPFHFVAMWKHQLCWRKIIGPERITIGCQNLANLHGNIFFLKSKRRDFVWEELCSLSFFGLNKQVEQIGINSMILLEMHYSLSRAPNDTLLYFRGHECLWTETVSRFAE